VYDFSRAFPLGKHPYKRGSSTFNGKPERTQRPAIMTLDESLKEYERQKEKEIIQMFNSDGDDLK